MFWGLLSLIGIVVVLAVMFTAAVPMSSDVLRHRIVQSLSEKLDADGQLLDISSSTCCMDQLAGFRGMWRTR